MATELIDHIALQDVSDVLPLVVAGLALSVAMAAGWRQRRLQRPAGQALVAEGEVQAYALQHTAVYNSTAKRYDRSTWQSFHAGGVAFVHERGGGVGFHHSAEPPLPISDGLRLRLHPVEDTEGDRSQRRILRVQRPCAAPCAVGQG